MEGCVCHFCPSHSFPAGSKSSYIIEEDGHEGVPPPEGSCLFCFAHLAECMYNAFPAIKNLESAVFLAAGKHTKLACWPVHRKVWDVASACRDMQGVRTNSSVHLEKAGEKSRCHNKWLKAASGSEDVLEWIDSIRWVAAVRFLFNCHGFLLWNLEIRNPVSSFGFSFGQVIHNLLKYSRKSLQDLRLSQVLHQTTDPGIPEWTEPWHEDQTARIVKYRDTPGLFIMESIPQMLC